MTGVQTCALPICFPVTIWRVGVPQVDVAERYSVSQCCISRIMRGKAWSHLTGIYYNGKNYRIKYSDETIQRARELAATGLSFRAIGRTLGMSHQYVGEIARLERRQQ